ncbi:MAG: hypothetical protein NTZ93_01905 [Candidatus Beckwithbacteria bacterium]|nr:hypothetical protein [Candidatus Beckwithbacteria bacterium]
MKKLSKITSLVSAFVLSLVLFAQSAYADLIVPGGKGGSPGRLIPKNELIIYGVVAGVVIVVIVVSVIVLIKIRKKNVNK